MFWHLYLAVAYDDLPALDHAERRASDPEALDRLIAIARGAINEPRVTHYADHGQTVITGMVAGQRVPVAIIVRR